MNEPNMLTKVDWEKIKLATGFDFESTPNGDVLIEFFGDDQETFNAQVITLECIRGFPEIAMLLCAKVAAPGVFRDVFVEGGVGKQLEKDLRDIRTKYEKIARERQADK